jgi:RNA polymerase sigma factor (sigma-70 family)
MVMILSDEELVLLRKKDPEVYRKVVNAYQLRIYYFVLKRVNDEFDAETLTADTMLWVWKSLDTVQSNDHLKRLFYLTATHKVANLYRKRKRKPNKLVDLSKPPTEISDPDSRDPHAILEAEAIERFWETHVIPVIRDLPKNYGEAARKHYLEKKSTEDIAKEMNVSPKDVAGYLEYAIKRIAEIIKDKGTLFLLTFLLTELFSKITTIFF